MLLAILAS